MLWRILGKLPAMVFAATLPVSLMAGELAQPLAPPQNAAAPPADGAAMIAPVHAVSLRAGPGGDNPVIGTLRPGVPVEVLATANHGWLQVRSAAGEGWAWGAYFPSGAAQSAPSAGTSPAEIKSP